MPALLLLSARSWEDALYRDELIDYEKQDNGFSVVFALTRSPAMRQGDYSRRVDAAMMSEVLARLPEAPRNVFVCGSNAFVNSAAEAPSPPVCPSAASEPNATAVDATACARLTAQRQRYFAALMNWLNASHHTTAVV